jgi:hypothetical protein
VFQVFDYETGYRDGLEMKNQRLGFETPARFCVVDKAAQKYLLKRPSLLRDSAGSLPDHIDHDVRIGDRDSMR